MGFPAVRFVDDLVPNRTYFIVRVDSLEVTKHNVKCKLIKADIVYRGTKTAFKLMMEESSVLRPKMMVEVIQHYEGKENVLTLGAEDFALTGNRPRKTLSAIFCDQVDRAQYADRLKSGKLTEQELCISRGLPFEIAELDSNAMGWLKKAR